MLDFKKAIGSTLTVFLLFVLFSLYFMGRYPGNFDLELRNQLNGQIDFVVSGASQAQCAIYTRTLDQELGCTSYNVSYDGVGGYEKRMVLREVFEENPVDTVVLELSYDTMRASCKTHYTRSTIFTAMRLSSLADRLEYFVKYVGYGNNLFVYSKLMFESMTGIRSSGERLTEDRIDWKGSRFIAGKDHSLTEQNAAKKYNSTVYSLDEFDQETVDCFTELVQFCKDKCRNVVVVVVPVSHRYLWQMDNLDDFDQWARAYCAELEVPYFDFNLLRSRYTLLSDEDCFSTDTQHMSETGSRAFTPVLAQVLKACEAGEDVSDCFYPSFAECKLDSPYQQYRTE